VVLLLGLSRRDLHQHRYVLGCLGKAAPSTDVHIGDVVSSMHDFDDDEMMMMIEMMMLMKIMMISMLRMTLMITMRLMMRMMMTMRLMMMIMMRMMMMMHVYIVVHNH